MTITLSTAARNTIIDALRVLLDAGSGPATVQIRSGTRPAGPGTTATGTLLATVTLADPATGAASSGSSSFTDPASVDAVATGTATWARILDSNGTAVIDCKVTATGGGGDITLEDTALVSGEAVDITVGTLSQPAGTAD